MHHIWFMFPTSSLEAYDATYATSVQFWKNKYQVISACCASTQSSSPKGLCVVACMVAPACLAILFMLSCLCSIWKWIKSVSVLCTMPCTITRSAFVQNGAESWIVLHWSPGWHSWQHGLYCEQGMLYSCFSTDM